MKPKQSIMKKMLLIPCAFLFVSCFTTMNTVGLKRRTFDDVALNALLKAELGEKLIEKGREEFQEAYVIKSTPSFSINMVPFPYAEGDVLPLAAVTKIAYLYYSKDLKYVGNPYMIGISKNKQTGRIGAFLNSANGMATKFPEGFSVEPTTYRDKSCSYCYKQEFIFNGRVANNLKFIYREYVEDLARPSFTQELQYDLNESKIIGFKGMRLEVVNATNTNLDYKILSSFSE